jgi:predicted DCC family thiol-disulfide oxidoreductase YuxK
MLLALDLRMSEVRMSEKHKGVVLFDGVCNFCDQAVLFLVDRDRSGHFAFAALQSPTARRLLAPHGLTDLSTIVLVEGDKVYTRSSAALRIARHMDGLWPLLSVLWLIPKPLRDAAYSYFAANRYRWFGKLEACRVPTPELRARFLDQAA